MNVIGDLDPRETIRRLAGPGLVVRMGPFRVRVASRIGHFRRQFVDLYRHHRFEAADDFIDFDLRLAARRSWTARGRRVAIFQFSGAEPLADLPIDQAMPLFEWGLNWCVTSHAHQFVIIHAGIVARDDRAILMPGASGVGKSSLTAALCARGWRLLSDELALIDLADGMAYPMPRPISVKNAAITSLGAFWPEMRVGCRVRETRKGELALLRPPEASVAEADRPARIARIIFPAYDRAQAARAEPVTPGRAFIETFESAFNYGVHRKRDFDLLADLMERAPATRLRYGDFDAALALIERLPVPVVP
jgi:HprK-related kinase A